MPPSFVQFLRDKKGRTPLPGRPPNRDKHPHQFIAYWARELYGCDLDLIERLLHERHGERSVEMRLPAALVDLLALVLTEDDADDVRRREFLQEFLAFRRRSRKTKRWTYRKIQYAASMVALVMTCGYSGPDACDILQQQKFPHLKGEGNEGALYRRLNKAKVDGIFAGIYFDQPSRMDAHAALIEAGIDLPDDGKLSENRKFSWPFDRLPFRSTE